MSQALEFPCDFDFKIFGHTKPEFEITALSIVRETFPDIKEDAVKTKASSNGNYTSMTIRVRATSQAELDEVYQKLSKSPLILMSL